MGFLDVEIPDWLKPPSPADHARARSQAIDTGLKMGFNAAQDQRQREHQWEMEKMRLGQQTEQFNKRLDFDRARFDSQRRLDDLDYQIKSQQVASQPKVIGFLKTIGEMTDPDLIASYPMPDNLDPQSLTFLEGQRLQRVKMMSALKQDSAAQSARNSWVDLATRNMGTHKALSARILAVLQENPDYLSTDAVSQLQDISKMMDEQSLLNRRSELAMQFENRERLKQMGLDKSDRFYNTRLSPEALAAYKGAIAGITDPSEQIRILRLFQKAEGVDLTDEIPGPVQPDSPKATDNNSWIPDSLRNFWNNLGGPPLPSGSYPEGTASPSFPFPTSVRPQGYPFNATPKPQQSVEVVAPKVEVDAGGIPQVPKPKPQFRFDPKSGQMIPVP